MATYTSGGVRKATANTVTAMIRSAESRRCPVCRRKSALHSTGATEYVGAVRACQWAARGLCTYDETAVRRHLIERLTPHRDTEGMARAIARHQRRLAELEDTEQDAPDA